MQKTRESGIAKYLVVAVICLALILVAGIILLTRHTPHKGITIAASGCVIQTLGVGSSGSCVKDMQTMVNFIESDGLTECPFTGRARLGESDSYDTATKQQVQVIQDWSNCYNKQEGSNTTITVNGTVAPSTWLVLCTYGYKFPSQSNSSISSYRRASLAAGKHAGCATLF